MPPSVVGRLPGTPGVYRFTDIRGRVLYIGRATTLRSRVASYWSDLRDRRHLAPMVARIDRIEAVSCDSVHEAAWLERNLLQTALPPWNRTPGGQESAVYIRLDPLCVVYQPEPGDRGPYLGGLRARQAVAGLHRILPLSYAGARLTGTEADLARVRGVAGADRTALLASLTAILDREPAAVAAARDQLIQARDRASGALAFEFAARIQDEIDALGWITGPQRVTTMTATDLTFAAWSAGTLVEFGIRGGRLCSWIQRPCRLPGAVPEPPPGWQDFAQRNADLAARLSVMK
jgi:excinuclease ABC subunit C